MREDSGTKSFLGRRLHRSFCGISLQLLLHLFLFYLSLHTIHSVLNTSVKVSGGAHHYLPLETSFKLCYVMLC